MPWTLSSLDGDFVFALATGAATRPPVTPKLEVQEELRQQFGSVALSSRLEDVEVWLGDQRIGQTHVGRALLINNVPEGMHRVLAKKDGYRDFTMDITVVARQTVDIDLKLEGLRPPVASLEGTTWGGSDENGDWQITFDSGGRLRYSRALYGASGSGTWRQDGDSISFDVGGFSDRRGTIAGTIMTLTATNKSGTNWTEKYV